MGQIRISFSPLQQAFIDTSEVQKIYIDEDAVFERGGGEMYLLQSGGQIVTWTKKILNTNYISTENNYLHTYSSSNSSKMFWYAPLMEIPAWAHTMHVMCRYYYASDRGKPYMGFGLLPETTNPSAMTYSASGTGKAPLNPATVQHAEYQPSATSNPGTEYTIDISGIDKNQKYYPFVSFYTSSNTGGKRTDGYWSNVWFD